VSDSVGVILIASGGVAVLVTAFLLRTVLPAVAVFALLAAGSVIVGAGALVVQDGVTAADRVVTLVALAVLGPAHVRVVLGPFGARRREASAT